MDCPSCGKPTRTLETRPTRDGRTRRRRECQDEACGERFTTLEQMAHEHLHVRKRDGRTQPFSRDKLRKSIRKASVKSLVPTEADIDVYLQRVLASLKPPAHGQPISSVELGRLVLRAMEGSDAASLITRVRYAIVFIGGRRGRSGGFRTEQDFLNWLAENFGRPDMSAVRALPYTVIKRDGSRERFNPKDIERSVGIASKGQGTDSQVHLFAMGVVRETLKEIESQALVTSQQIAAEVLKVLRRRNGIAYLRYASAVKRYTAIEDFWLDARSLPSDGA